MTQEISLSATILERAAAIMQLNRSGLSLDWLKEFSIPNLINSCARKDNILPGVSIIDKALERELIQNPAFAAWYAKLLPMFPNDPPAEPKPAPTYSRYSSAPAAPTSRRAELMTALRHLLETCTVNAKDITSYPQTTLMDVISLDQFTGYMQLVFLENFAFDELSEEARQTVISGIRHCSEIPLKLTKNQKIMLQEPAASVKPLFASAPFVEICDLLENCQELLDIIRLLYRNHIREELTQEDYKVFAKDATEYHRLLAALIERIGPDAVSLFMKHWQKSECSMRELRYIDRQTKEHPELDWSELFSTYSGYVNQIYGARFKQIDMAYLAPCQENILIYAIVHNKRHFIKLVDEHVETFLGISRTSFLFQEELYQEHLNLNELTEKDLKDCAWMMQHNLNVQNLAPGRKYTFQELKALYDATSQYITFYHALQSDSQDYRLKIFRQIQKRSLLRYRMTDEKIIALAAHLDVKPLDAWMQTDFGHIRDLTATDAAQMLIHLDKLRHLLPSIQTRRDVLIALHNLDVLAQCESIAMLKEKLFQTDVDWHLLAKNMKLTPEFQQQHKANIIKFLCNNGANIAETYRKNLNDKQQETFLRVVKAELMGQLDKLKYYDGDLQRGLNSPLTARVKIGWRVNLHVSNNGLEVREYDDFFSTILPGTQPKRTCLSYIDGAYKECLLSAFDSNKKILYAVLDGHIVGRAFLRLTISGASGKGEDIRVSVTEERNSRNQRFQPALAGLRQRGSDLALDNVQAPVQQDQQPEVRLQGAFLIPGFGQFPADRPAALCESLRRQQVLLGAEVPDHCTDMFGAQCHAEHMPCCLWELMGFINHEGWVFQ